MEIRVAVSDECEVLQLREENQATAKDLSLITTYLLSVTVRMFTWSVYRFSISSTYNYTFIIIVGEDLIAPRVDWMKESSEVFRVWIVQCWWVLRS